MENDTEAMRARIEWLEAEVASLAAVCPARYRPDPRERLAPAEEKMSPGERAEYEVTPKRIKELFQHVAKREGALLLSLRSMEFERDEWIGRVRWACERAEKAEAALETALKELKIKQGKPEGGDREPDQKSRH